MFQNVIALADSFLQMGIPGYHLVIYKDGQCVINHYAGFSDLEGKKPLTGQEHYDIYSCSKILTCTAALQLWEQGKFQLSDKLSDYMPEFAQMTVETENGIVPAENPILIEHLFTMTAGFSYNVNSNAVKACQKATGGRCPTREFMKYLAKEPLLFEPGDQYKYSLCHDVLAALVEVLSGEKFEDYVKSHIFDPVGMENSSFLAQPVCGKFAYNAATKQMSPIADNGYRMGTEYASGGAGAVSTAEDYIAFLEALRTGKLLKPETVRLMSTNRLTDHQKRTFLIPGRGYGLGVRTPLPDDPHTEFGWGGAAGAYASVDTTLGVSIFYVQHVLASPNNALRKQLYELVFDELTGMETTAKRQNDAEKNLTY